MVRVVGGRPYTQRMTLSAEQLAAGRLRYEVDGAVATITLDTLYDAKAHYAR